MIDHIDHGVARDFCKVMAARFRQWSILLSTYCNDRSLPPACRLDFSNEKCRAFLKYERLKRTHRALLHLDESWKLPKAKVFILTLWTFFRGLPWTASHPLLCYADQHAVKKGWTGKTDMDEFMQANNKLDVEVKSSTRRMLLTLSKLCQ